MGGVWQWIILMETSPRVPTASREAGTVLSGVSVVNRARLSDLAGEEALGSLAPAHSQFWGSAWDKSSVGFGGALGSEGTWNGPLEFYSPGSGLAPGFVWNLCLSWDSDSVSLGAVVLEPQRVTLRLRVRGSVCDPPQPPPNEWPWAAHSTSPSLSFPTGQRDHRSACPWDPRV